MSIAITEPFFFNGCEEGLKHLELSSCLRKTCPLTPSNAAAVLADLDAAFLALSVVRFCSFQWLNFAFHTILTAEQSTPLASSIAFSCLEEEEEELVELKRERGKKQRKPEKFMALLGNARELLEC